MQLEKYISELLFEHDCVIVPEFGGFVCNYAPAGINPTKHQFHPPYKKISFNRHLKNNDGLLANQIVQAEGLTYSEANRAISEFVQALLKELDSDKRFDLKRIGSFFVGEENTLQFEQDETVNYLPASFGFSIFNSPAIKREPIERKIERKLKDRVIIPSKEEPAVVPAKRRTSRVLLTAAATLLLGFLAWLPFQTGMMKNIDYASLNPFAPGPQPRYSPDETALPDPDNDVSKADVSNLLAMAGKDTTRYLNIVIDGNIPIVVKLKDEGAAVTPAPAPTPKLRTPRKMSTRSSGKHFHVVGGAFAIPENAEKLVRKLIENGYDATIIDKKGGALRFVSYGAFDTKEEAMEALERIRAVQGDAWLMTN